MIFERIVEQFKNFFSKRKRIVILIVLTVLLVTYLILGFIMQQIIDGLPDQHAAERWDPDSRISQVSMFFTEDQMITENTIRKLVAALEDQNERFKADLEEIHEAIWDVDIPSPTCPEYREHHQQMQEGNMIIPEHRKNIGLPDEIIARGDDPRTENKGVLMSLGCSQCLGMEDPAV